MKNILSIEGLSKNYGAVQAVDNLTLSVRQGDVYGILGPNGSGKTTTLGIILGVINQSEGSFSWFDQGNSHQMRKSIGALLDKPNFYPHLSGVENLRLAADIKEIKKPKISEKLELAGLSKASHRKFYSYSTGMKQRLALASTFLGNPEVLVLDEPTNGLDPEGIADVRNLILKIAGEGITVIMASHLLDEVQKVCSHVAVIKNGKNLYEGQVQTLLSGEEGIEISSDNLIKLESVLVSYEGIEKYEKRSNHYLVKLKTGFKAAQLSGFLITNGVDITQFSHRKGSLEQEFLQLLSEKND